MAETFEYIIITVGNYTDAQINEFNSHCETSVEFARYNSGKTKCILKLATNKPTPDCFMSLTRYNKTEILSPLSESEWNEVSHTTLTTSQIAAIDTADESADPER